MIASGGRATRRALLYRTWTPIAGRPCVPASAGRTSPVQWPSWRSPRRSWRGRRCARASPSCRPRSRCRWRPYSPSRPRRRPSRCRRRARRQPRRAARRSRGGARAPAAPAAATPGRAGTPPRRAAPGGARAPSGRRATAARAPPRAATRQARDAPGRLRGRARSLAIAGRRPLPPHRFRLPSSPAAAPRPSLQTAEAAPRAACMSDISRRAPRRMARNAWHA